MPPRAAAARPRRRCAAPPGTRWRPGSAVRLGSAVGSERSARSGWRGRPSSPRPSISRSPGHALAVRLVRRGRELAALRARVEQDAEDLVARDAVDHRVVHLRQQRHAPVRQALDQVELPQRARAVQRPGEDPRDRLGEPVVVARRRHGRSRGCGSRGRSPGPRPSTAGRCPNGTLDQPPAERRQQVQALGRRAGRCRRSRACRPARSTGRRPRARRRARTCAPSPRPGTARPGS